MTWEEAIAKVKLLSLTERKKLLRQHPSLFCRLFELKQELVNKCILDGNDKLMGKVMDRFMRAEFQAKGRVNYHIMISFQRSIFNEDDVFSDDPEILEKIKEYVADKITTVLLNILSVLTIVFIRCNFTINPPVFTHGLWTIIFEE